MQVLLDGSKRCFGPAPEKPSKNALLPDEPIQILQAGNYNKVPLLIGYCDAEGMLGIFLGATGQIPIHNDFENFVPHSFQLERGSNESKRIAQKIKDFYYKGKEPSLETLANYIEVSRAIKTSLISRGLPIFSWNQTSSLSMRHKKPSKM